MSELGQNRKSSMRANVFWFAPESGHRAMQSACPFRAISGLMHRSNLTAYSITSPARPSSDRGIARSSVLAVLRLMADSIFIGDRGRGSACDLLVPIRTIVLGGNP
jgi:hypothetical protein